MGLSENYQSIRSRILKAAGSSEAAEKITLIAVSKFQPLESIMELHALGHRDFGENYVQELLEKSEKLKESGITDIRWHFIGGLQSNKVKALLPHVTMIHSVDSEKLAREISKQATTLLLRNPLPIFISVNLHGETTKSGIDPNQLNPFISELTKLSGIQLMGLMCIPSPEKDATLAFAELRRLESTSQPMTHGLLSMGMTQDFEEAIREGATHIRVGTALFGQRPPL
jgi:PLP dependent protein